MEEFFEISDDAFDRTLQVCREVGFSRVHIFPYSHRRGTDASTLPDLPAAVKKARFGALHALAAELTDSFCRRFVGREVEVLVEEPGGGYTERYLRARVASGRPNDLVRARVIAARDGGLECA